MMAELLPVVFTVIVGLTFPYLPISRAGDNTDLLMSTLRSRFVFACDKDFLTFKCPNNTAISIDNANYGRQVPNEHMCPYRWSTAGSQPAPQVHEDTNCKAENSRQVIQNMCESRQFCKMRVASDLFGGDPCPGTNKYLDVTYKCKPSTFRNMVVCEDSHMTLHCEDKEVLAIHSAGFGRPIAANMKCPSFSMDETECTASSSLEEVMKRCHGKRHCAVKASARIFGEPCQEGTYRYLSVTYSCVSKRIFRKPRRYTGAVTVPQGLAAVPTTPSNGHVSETGGQTMAGSDDSRQGVSVLGTAASNDSMASVSTTANSGHSQQPSSHDDSNGFFTSVVAALGTIQLNAEMFILYTSIGCCVGIIATLLWCVARLKCKNYHLKKKMKESGVASNANGANRTVSQNGSMLESVRQENRVDINEIWNTPPPPSVSITTPNATTPTATTTTTPTTRPENGINSGRPRWDHQANAVPREAHTLPATRNLNSYFP